jgi:hypothetical protein
MKYLFLLKHAIKAYEGVEIQLDSLTSALAKVSGQLQSSAEPVLCSCSVTNIQGC